jgi:uncharacterized protein
MVLQACTCTAASTAAISTCSVKGSTMQVAITGASGLIGQQLVSSLRSDGHRVRPLARPASASQARRDPEAIDWDPVEGTVDRAELESVDAVVHLGAVGIGDRRLSETHKRAVRDSRIQGTETIARNLAGMDRPPGVLVAASAVGYYGDRGDEILTESSPPGSGFTAEVDLATEQATEAAQAAGIRVVLIRSGMVLSRSGGALRRMLLPFQLGLGGWFGSGKQWWSYIALDDEVRAIRFVLDNEGIEGPVNLTTPEPATNREFTKALGRALRRPVLVPVPTIVPELMLGRDMAREMVLASRRVQPTVLEGAGYRFLYPDVDSALEAALRE